MNIYLDIETIPQQPEESVKAAIAESITPPSQMSKAETIAEWHAGTGKYEGVKDALIEETYRKTALDGAKGEVLSVAFAIEDDGIICAIRGDDRDESGVLSSVFSTIKSGLGGRTAFFIGHYIGGFDLKFLFQRAVILGVNPNMDLCQWGRHGSHFYDTMQAWAGYGNHISQANLAAALGIEGKPDDIDGSNVWDHYKAGDIQKIADYNKSDVETVRAIHKRLTFSS